MKDSRLFNAHAKMYTNNYLLKIVFFYAKYKITLFTAATS